MCNYEDIHPEPQKRSPQIPPGGKNLERKTLPGGIQPGKRVVGEQKALQEVGVA